MNVLLDIIFVDEEGEHVTSYPNLEKRVEISFLPSVGMTFVIGCHLETWRNGVPGDNIYADVTGLYYHLPQKEVNVQLSVRSQDYEEEFFVEDGWEVPKN